MSTLRIWNPLATGLVRATIVGAALIVGACGDGEPGGTAGGDAATEVAALDYEVTPERYQRWVAAQQALDAIPNLPAPPRIDPMRLDEAGLRRAVDYLEGDARARAALARAGISARDYVLTTVALDQALVAAAASDPVPSGGSPAATSPRGAGAAPARTASPPTSRSERATVAAAPREAPAARPRRRPRLTGTPPRNVELVRRNRDDVVRVLRTMRFRIAEPMAGDVTDTTVRRSDSITVGKDITVKWDVTIRRGRDTTGGSDSARRDSTRSDSTDRD